MQGCFFFPCWDVMNPGESESVTVSIVFPGGSSWSISGRSDWTWATRMRETISRWANHKKGDDVQKINSPTLICIRSRTLELPISMNFEEIFRGQFWKKIFLILTDMLKKGRPPRSRAVRSRMPRQRAAWRAWMNWKWLNSPGESSCLRTIQDDYMRLGVKFGYIN